MRVLEDHQHGLPVRETLERTMAEVLRCTKAGIQINTFALDIERSQFPFVEQIAKVNGGRLFYTDVDDLGSYALDDFVKHQGTAMEQWSSLWTPMAVSDDGTTIAGWGVGFQWYGGWVLDMKKVFVCHASPGHKAETIRVEFPKAFDEHLADGDTPGRCP